MGGSDVESPATLSSLLVTVFIAVVAVWQYEATLWLAAAVAACIAAVAVAAALQSRGGVPWTPSQIAGAHRT
jgi:hypothetical protein